MNLRKYLQKNLLYLAILAFVFISSSALAISTEKPLGNLPIIEKVLGQYDFAPIPHLKEDANFPIISAQSVLAVDLSSGTVLYEKDPEKPLLPASTTKILTAVVAMEAFKNDDILTVGPGYVEGQKMGLIAGERIAARDLLYGLLIYSANDAAEAFAYNYPGGRVSFVAAMNAKAQDLGLGNSNFANPSGLEDAGHISTAKDLVRIATYAMENERFAQVVSTENHLAQSVDGIIRHRLTNINELIGKVDGVLGVKTGWTYNSRENLVTYVKRGEKEVMIALLGSQDRFGETEELIEWIYGNYEWREVKLP